MLLMPPQTFKRLLDNVFLKYAAIGGLGFVLDFSTTFCLKEFFYINAYIASSTGMFLAIVNNFAFHKYWTFKTKGGNIWRQFLPFLISSVAVILLNNILVFHLSKHLNFYLSKIIVICCLASLNYVICKTYIFTANSGNIKI